MDACDVHEISEFRFASAGTMRRTISFLLIQFHDFWISNLSAVLLFAIKHQDLNSTFCNLKYFKVFLYGLMSTQQRQNWTQKIL